MQFLKALFENVVLGNINETMSIRSDESYNSNAVNQRAGVADADVGSPQILALIQDAKEVTLAKAAGKPIWQPRAEPNDVTPICKRHIHHVIAYLNTSYPLHHVL